MLSSLQHFSEAQNQGRETLWRSEREIRSIFLRLPRQWGRWSHGRIERSIDRVSNPCRESPNRSEPPRVSSSPLKSIDDRPRNTDLYSFILHIFLCNGEKTNTRDRITWLGFDLRILIVRIITGYISVIQGFFLAHFHLIMNRAVK